MSKYSMTDRVELSEALRSILDDSDTEEKENINMACSLSPKITSPRLRSCTTPIMKRKGVVGASGRPKSALTPSRMHNNNVEKRKSVGFEIVRSPPKKRRHANQVIILRQPRRHYRQSKSTPKPSTNTDVQTHTRRSDLNMDSCIVQGLKREFTVELETGTATAPPEQEEIGLNRTIFSSPIIQPPASRTVMLTTPPRRSDFNMDSCIARGLKREFTVELETGTATAPPEQVDLTRFPFSSPIIQPPAPRTVMLTTPPRSSALTTPSSSEKCLEAAIETQIKMELTEEEIESGLPMLEGLDPTASPLCHFTDSNQRQLYSELSSLDDVNGAAWPANQEDALQMAANQQLIQIGGRLFYGNGEQLLQGFVPNGRWVTQGTSADESLTNITWLKRMSAPDLDPNTLQSTQMTDPRYERPPYSYSTLIQFAISSSRVGKMTLREIYAWIEETFPYFKSAKAGWRNSIRHNLSLHKIFIREPPMNHGQPAFWTLRSGTVVRLPEQRMYVADLENGGTLLQEIAPPSSMMRPNVMMGPHPPRSQQGGFFMGGAMPQVVMVPPPGGAVGNNKGNMMKGTTASAHKAKKPPLILPRGSQPYALVPVPLLLPSGQTSGDRPTNLPHILSPVIMGGVRRFAPQRQMVGGRKVVPIAPKITPNDVSMPNSGMNHSGHLSSMSNTSCGSDSGIDLSGQSLTPGLGSTSGYTSFGKTESTPNRELPFKKKGQKRKSMPKIWEDIEDETEAEDSFTAFFEQELCSPPRQQSRNKGMPVVSTPCKSTDLQNWLSPLRSFTPFRNSPLDGDSAIFEDLQDDLSLNSIQTGLTPNFKGRLRGGSSSTRGQRSNLGSLGDFGLPGLTPEKNLNGDGDHNQSFGHIFGDLNVSLDMGSQGMDIGELGWSVFSPNKHQVT